MSDDGTVRRVEGDELARARERFLTVDVRRPVGVRQSILASWSRSRESNVLADQLALQYVRDGDLDLDTPLTRSARPVLRQLAEQLDGQAVSIVLTDPKGVVLSRVTSDLALERQLDAISLAPGFSYAEAVVGTNGIGTALEAGRPMQVFGHEHYAEDLEELACAGVPVRHPTTGRTVGVLDLTCWRKDAGPLLMTLAKTTAEQIRQALLLQAGVQEIALLHAYLRACQHSSGMVFALSDDVVMMNAPASSALVAEDQVSLLRHAAEALAARRPSSTVELPSGVQVRLHTRPVQGAGWVSGAVVDVKVVPTATTRAGASGQTMLLPGLVGTSPLWQRACHEAEDAYRTGQWLALEGEAGSGKLALLRALHQRVDPSGHLAVVDGATSHGRSDAAWLAGARQVLAEESGTVVLRHLERLHAVPLRALCAAAQETAGRPGVWLALSVRTDPVGAETTRLLQLFPTTVHVPPLRHHAADVQQLVAFLLARLGHGSTVTCSTEALQLLQRSSWPGNVEQLVEVLRGVLRQRRTGAITAAELPPEVQAGSRRRLGTLEAMERDAIAHALHDAAGNKASAARALGMSRATIYRKIHDYGLVLATRP
ncbi:MAG: Fis family transcriptional regulator [Frankiales bacterium]|nr:Fis family transcriptional regulator [Frankiales bacterium]